MEHVPGMPLHGIEVGEIAQREVGMSGRHFRFGERRRKQSPPIRGVAEGVRHVTHMCVSRRLCRNGKGDQEAGDGQPENGPRGR